MNLFHRKKKILQNDLTWEQMTEAYNIHLFERAEFQSQQLKLALELAEKRRLDYIR